jgi:Zn-dependent alcohol dehydrogenase
MHKSRAAVFPEHGKPLVIDEVVLPEPGPSDVAVKIHATGICHSQLHQIFHMPRQNVPVVLGHEATGVISAVGSQVTYVKEGDRVMVGWLPRAPYPGMQRPAQPSFTYKGTEAQSGGGNASTWSETTVVHEQFVVKLDDGVSEDDMEATAIIGCAVMTGAGAALNTARVDVGTSVAVFGVGGVGLSCVQACAIAGAYPIITVDLHDDKLEFARAFGATHGVNASRDDPVAKVRELTGGLGVDFSFDAIGAPKTLEQFIPVVRQGVSGVSDGGTAVLIGVPTAPLQFQMNQMWNRRLTGSLGGASRPERDFPNYVRWFREGRFPLDKLVSRRYKLEQINEALSDLMNGQIAGRSIIVF